MEKQKKMDVPLRKLCVFVVFIILKFDVKPNDVRTKLSFYLSPNPCLVVFLIFLYWYFYLERKKSLPLYCLDLYLND